MSDLVAELSLYGAPHKLSSGLEPLKRVPCIRRALPDSGLLLFLDVFFDDLGDLSIKYVLETLDVRVFNRH